MIEKSIYIGDPLDAKGRPPYEGGLKLNITGGELMKKLVAIVVSILFALSMTGLCFAQADKMVAPKDDKMMKSDDKAKAGDQMTDKKAAKKAKKAKKEKKEEGMAPAAPEKK